MALRFVTILVLGLPPDDDEAPEESKQNIGIVEDAAPQHDNDPDEGMRDIDTVHGGEEDFSYP